ncbi:hypothetical protein C4D60_Mb01t28310 [Musa balbisiana]|uniref:Glutaredoxin domain-containing protein n=1 Tax=Musa balbisiana TaxID=52838 RepID=A0A4S8JRD5_MUSBA|nr:hypothetical protein C4D60_Mb01t28310 [Musa balbisiana]
MDWEEHAMLFLVLGVVLLANPKFWSSSRCWASANESNIIIYDKHIVCAVDFHLPYSVHKVKAVFKELKKAFYVVELDQCEDGSQIQDALSEMVEKRTVPQVFIHGKHLGGSDDTVEAYESGRILTLLGIDSKDNL